MVIQVYFTPWEFNLFIVLALSQETKDAANPYSNPSLKLVIYLYFMDQWKSGKVEKFQIAKNCKRYLNMLRLLPVAPNKQEESLYRQVKVTR